MWDPPDHVVFFILLVYILGSLVSENDDVIYLSKDKLNLY